MSAALFGGCLRTTQLSGGAKVAYRRGLVGPIALLVIGVVLLLRNLGYFPASLDQWWPVILILLGLWILFTRSTPGGTPTPKEPGPLAPPGSPAPTMEGRHHPPTGGLILIGLGVALLAANFLGGRGTGALIMIALGLALLIGRIW